MHHMGLLQGVLDVGASLLLVNGAEDEIHLFQGPALGFFEEDNNEHTHGKAKNAKHKECSPADLVDSPRSDLGDDKVEKPLCGCSKADTVRTKTGWEDLKCRLLVK
jgi:hypothetical protein